MSKVWGEMDMFFYFMCYCGYKTKHLSKFIEFYTRKDAFTLCMEVDYTFMHMAYRYIKRFSRSLIIMKMQI